jgi:hypothetical protein
MEQAAALQTNRSGRHFFYRPSTFTISHQRSEPQDKNQEKGEIG